MPRRSAIRPGLFAMASATASSIDTTGGRSAGHDSAVHNTAYAGIFLDNRNKLPPWQTPDILSRDSNGAVFATHYFTANYGRIRRGREGPVCESGKDVRSGRFLRVPSGSRRGIG